MLIILVKSISIGYLGMSKKGFTLIELIFVVVIVAILSVATFKALQTLLVRSYKAKETTRLSLESQVALNQIGEFLSNRVPSTVIGYDPDSGEFEYIGDLTSNKPILEWIGMADESMLNRGYSGFIDLKSSNRDENITFSPNSNGDNIEDTTQKKFGVSVNVYSQKILNLIFAGSFDRGRGDIVDYNNSFGWHGNDSLNSFDIDINSTGYIKITDNNQPKFIYEKYYLVDSAYAVARRADLEEINWNCGDLNWNEIDDNTLLLFYNYRPWKGETFCADSSGNLAGNVTVLMENVARFRFEEIDFTIRVSLDINKSIKGSTPIHISKMKVIF